MDTEVTKGLLQLGGLGMFALVVWWELRQQRNERQADAAVMREVIAELRDAVTQLVERDRMRFEDTPPPPSPSSTGYRKPGTPIRGIDIVRPRRKPDEE